MAQSRNNINLSSLLLTCMNSSDTMLRWLCGQMMEAGVSSRLSARKNQHDPNRKGYRCSYRTRRLDTRMGTSYRLVPKVREGGYISFFITERKYSETALVQDSYLFKKEARSKIPYWWFLTDIRGLLRPFKRAFPDVRDSTAKSI